MKSENSYSIWPAVNYYACQNGRIMTMVATKISGNKIWKVEYFNIR